MSSQPTRPPTAKRSPSILVTDVRSTPNGGRPAPFAGAHRRTQPISGSTPSYNAPSSSSQSNRSNRNSGSSSYGAPGSSSAPYQGYGPRGRIPPQLGNKFGRISIDNILSDVSDIPSAQRRSVPGATVTSLRAGNRKPARIPPRVTQNIPQRTTKLSEKLVLIPEDIAPGFKFDDDDADSSPPPDEEEAMMSVSSDTRKSYAERLPKDRRTNKFPRLTAFCVSDAIRLPATAEYLRENHKILPRIYEEALYAPYYLPLLPGDGDCRVKSSPGGMQLMEEFIDRSEQFDHHFEYYSGLETGKSPDEPEPMDDSQGALNEHDDAASWNLHENEFDPSEPQAFSPPKEPSFLKPRSRNTSPHKAKDEEHAPEHEIGVESEEPIVEEFSEPPSPPIKTPDVTKHAELFIFTYGVIVFWNFTEQQEKEILADLNFARVEGPRSKANADGLPTSLIVRPINEQDIETEELHFTYSAHTVKPRIYNDMVTLRSGDHMIKLAMSHAIAQSTKLSRFEARMDLTMHDVRHVPKMLALTGRLGFKREEVLKISGKLFKLRVDVNLSSNVLDTPDFFWEDEPSLNPLYTAVREYLEIEQRILVLNERCKVFLDLTEIIADTIAEYNMSRITWIIIILIALSLAVSTLEIVMRFNILRRTSPSPPQSCRGCEGFSY